MSSQRAKTSAFILTDKTTWVFMRCPVITRSTMSVWNWREKHAERTFISVNQRKRFSGWRAENIAHAFLYSSCDPLMAGKRCFVCRRKCYSFFLDSTRHLLLSAAIAVSPISLSCLLSLSLTLTLSLFFVHPSPSALSAWDAQSRGGRGHQSAPLHPAIGLVPSIHALAGHQGLFAHCGVYK